MDREPPPKCPAEPQTHCPIGLLSTVGYCFHEADAILIKYVAMKIAQCAKGCVVAF